MMLTLERPRPVRMITAWTRGACRRSYYTFAHSKRFRAAIELVALVVMIWLLVVVVHVIIARIFIYYLTSQGGEQ